MRLQDRGAEVFVLVADYQVLTDRDTAEHLDEHVLGLVLDYLAIGIDPARTTIFAHSAVPELNQLLLPFLSLVSVPELDRNPTVKDEIAHSRQSAVSGLMLTYPVHQAADILFCKGNLVPVGQDQLPHLEVTRLVARRFNERYGLGLPGAGRAAVRGAAAARHGRREDEQEPRQRDRAARQRGRDGPAHPGREDRRRTAHQLRPRRPAGGVDPGPAGRAVPGPQPAGRGRRPRRRRRARRSRTRSPTAVNEMLAPVRARRAEYARDLGYVRQVLHAGNERAGAIAAATLDEVSAAMGMRY